MAAILYTNLSKQSLIKDQGRLGVGKKKTMSRVMYEKGLILINSDFK